MNCFYLLTNVRTFILCHYKKIRVLHDKHLKLSYRYFCKIYVFIMPKLLIKYTIECPIAAHLWWPFFMDLVARSCGWFR